MPTSRILIALLAASTGMLTACGGGEQRQVIQNKAYVILITKAAVKMKYAHLITNN